MSALRSGIGLSLALMMLPGCKKEPPAAKAPLTACKSYALGTITTEPLPSGGYALQCTYPGSLRLDLAQFLSPNGDLLQRIDYHALPDSVDGLHYPSSDEQSICITDIVPWNGNEYMLIGFGRRFISEFNYKVDLLVFHVDAYGNELTAPFHRYLMNDASLNGAPILGRVGESNALGVQLLNGDLAVAAYYGKALTFRVTVFRFPLAGTGNNEASTTFYGSQNGGVFVMQRLAEPSEEIMLVLSTGISGEGLCVKKLSFDENNVHSTGGVLAQNASYLFPYTAADHNGTVVLSGSETNASVTDPLKPFLTSFSTYTNNALAEGFHLIDAALQQGPAQSYGGTWWNGHWAMLVNDYPPGTIAPFFPGDMESDLAMVIVSPTTGEIHDRIELIPGQGVRGIGLYNTGDGLDCIGTTYGYENEDVHHTLFMKIPGPDR